MDFSKNLNRRDSDSIKWNRYEEGILPLWVADTDFPVPDAVSRALSNRLSYPLFGYASVQSSTLQSIQHWLETRHGWRVELDDILLLPGVVHAFNLAASAVARPGDSVLIQTPAYHPFLEVSRNLGLRQQIHQLRPDSDGKYQLSASEFSAAIAPHTRIFMLCNPHNPTGRVFTRSELSLLADLCLENKIVICSDEIHSDIVYSGNQHIPIASLSESIAANTITLISPSKTFNLAGLQASAAIISNPALKELFKARMRAFSGSVNVLGEVALAAAYSSGADYLSQLLQYLQNNRDLLVTYVKNELPGIRIDPPEGTYLGWLDCTETGLSDPAGHFLQHARVALNPGTWFGSGFEYFARINFACPAEVLLSALENIKGNL